ncbi:MAG: anti-anti-sigma factor [Thermoleophilia bacterium]|nr:anti-anti-sigma factor [Thermoleophilia bacterium]
MSVVAKHGDLLYVTLDDDIGDHDMQTLLERLSAMTIRHKSRGVILDVSAMEVIDSFGCRMLQTITTVLRIHGARAVVCGVRPAVAFAMVQLALRLEDVETALDFEDAVQLLHVLTRAHV